MTKHLAPQHVVEAIDGTLAPAEQEHLRVCAACRGAVDEARAMLLEIRTIEAATPAPEPSPLFWDHFSERVRQATAPISPRPSWWESWLRPAALAGAALTVVALAVLVRPGAPRTDTDGVVVDAGVDPLVAFDDETWNLVVSLAGDLDWDEVQGVAAPRVGAADALLNQLSTEERATLVRLLKAEMGGFE